MFRVSGSGPSVWRSPAGNYTAIAPHYDSSFTNNPSARLQRDRTWELMATYFPPHGHVLELSCGTGEDALHLTRRGCTVTAFDASEGMVAEARRRSCGGKGATFEVFSLEQFATQPERACRSDHRAFDAALCNFGGMNCVEDIGSVFRALARVLKPGAPLLISLIGRFCLSEILWLGLRGHLRAALHRVPGREQLPRASLIYPSVTRVRADARPYFHELRIEALGLLLPPHRFASSLQRHPECLRTLARADGVAARLPGLRALGDHIVYVFERIPS